MFILSKEYIATVLSNVSFFLKYSSILDIIDREQRKILIDNFPKEIKWTKVKVNGTERKDQFDINEEDKFKNKFNVLKFHNLELIGNIEKEEVSLKIRYGFDRNYYTFYFKDRPNIKLKTQENLLTLSNLIKKALEGKDPYFYINKVYQDIFIGKKELILKAVVENLLDKIIPGKTWLLKPINERNLTFKLKFYVKNIEKDEVKKINEEIAKNDYRIIKIVIHNIKNQIKKLDINPDEEFIINYSVPIKVKEDNVAGFVVKMEIKS